jgi:hypothetical protein
VAKGAVAEARNKNATASTASAPGAPVDGNRTPAVTAATAASAPEPARNHTDDRPPSQVAATSTASTTTTVTAARSAVIGWVPTGARGAPTRSVPRIDHLTPMSRSAWCGSPKVRPTAHGVPTPVPRVARRVAQRPPRAAPTWTIGNRSMSGGLISVKVVHSPWRSTAGQGRLSSEDEAICGVRNGGTTRHNDGGTARAEQEQIVSG